MGWDLCPWEGTKKKKKAVQGQTFALGSEWVEPQTGCPSFGVLCRGDKTPLAAWRSAETNRKAGET